MIGGRRDSWADWWRRWWWAPALVVVAVLVWAFLVELPCASCTEP